MAFITIGNRFYNSDFIVSAELGTEKRETTDAFSITTEFSVFTLYGVDGKVIAKFGSVDDTKAGLLAFNAFGESVKTRP